MRILAIVLLSLSVSACQLLPGVGDAPPIDTMKKRVLVAEAAFRDTVRNLDELCFGDTQVIPTDQCIRARVQVERLDRILAAANTAVQNDQSAVEKLAEFRSIFADLVGSIPELEQ